MLDPSQQTSPQSRWLREAFEDHHRALLSYALRVTGGSHDRAEEAVQETYLRLCRQSPELLEGRVRAWLFKVCRTRIIDMQRAQPSAAWPSEEQVGDAPSAEMLVEGNETLGRLQVLVESLPQRQKELLHLKIHGQLSYREIAEATGLSISNVGYLLHQAMQTLRLQFAASERA